VLATSPEVVPELAKPYDSALDCDENQTIIKDSAEQLTLTRRHYSAAIDGPKSLTQMKGSLNRTLD
jgi:hypothetical protein